MIARTRLARRRALAARGATGQAQVEFILSILFLVLFIFGTLELILLIYTYNVLAAAAKEGVRYAVVHGSDSANCSGPGGVGVTCPDSSGSNVQAAVKQYAQYSFHSTAAMTIAVIYPDSSCDPPGRVQVQINYAYQPFFGLGWPTVTVKAAAAGRVVF